MATNAELYKALEAKNFDLVKDLLANGSVPDVSATTCAVRVQAHDILRLIIGACAELNSKDGWGYTPLVQAIKLKDYVALQILLEAGASPNISSSFGPPLSYAVSQGSEEAARRLIDFGADLEQRDSNRATPLIWAARNGDEKMTKLLLQAGSLPSSVDQFDRTAYDWAVDYRKHRVAAILAKHTRPSAQERPGLESLLEAIKSDNLKKIGQLLSSGVDVNARSKLGSTPIECAIDVGSVKTLRFLLGHGAKIDVVDQEGASPLDLAMRQWRPEVILTLLQVGALPAKGASDPIRAACAMGSLRVTRALLNVGSNPDAQDMAGNTALMAAVNAGAVRTVKLLLSRGAEINRTNRKGWTALFYAVQLAASTQPGDAKIQPVNRPQEKASGSYDEAEAKAVQMVTVLLNHGAEVNQRDGDGRTPLMWAKSTVIAKVLIQHKASLAFRDKRGHDAAYWFKKNKISV